MQRFVVKVLVNFFVNLLCFVLKCESEHDSLLLWTLICSGCTKQSCSLCSPSLVSRSPSSHANYRAICITYFAVGGRWFSYFTCSHMFNSDIILSILMPQFYISPWSNWSLVGIEPIIDYLIFLLQTLHDKHCSFLIGETFIEVRHPINWVQRQN